MGIKKMWVPLGLLTCLLALPSSAADNTGIITNVDELDLLLDVGYFVNVLDQSPIQLQQDPSSGNPYRDFVGCHVTPIECNFQLELVAEVKPNPVLGGQWTADVTPKFIPIGTTNTEICVTAKDVEVKNLAAGGKGVKVAEVKLKIIPLDL